MNTHSMKPWTILTMLALTLAGMQTVFAQEDAEQGQKALYERLGGLAPIAVVVNDFIDVLVADPVLNENPAVAEARDRVPAAYLKYHVTTMVCEVTGGPCSYHGRSMEESHAHLNITEEEWDRTVMLFQEVLDKHGVPQGEAGELLDIVATTKDDIVTGSP